MKVLAATILTLMATVLHASTLKIERIDPPFWWVGMSNPIIQLMVYGEDLAAFDVQIDHKGVVLQNAHRVENPNYIFLDLKIEKFAKPGFLDIQFRKPGEEHSHPFELKERGGYHRKMKGLDGSDLIYLLMPDRFANGDPGNDVVDGTKEMTIDRSQTQTRHGGDLKGVMDHLDYLADLGVTALWMNPVLENDQPQWSYHGYAATDLYQVDPRLGTNALYKTLTEKARKKGIKMIMDIIHNHIGDRNWLYLDPPGNDWVHHHDVFTKTSYRATTIMDPYASEFDRNVMKNGWFDHHMPDLNQDHPLLTTYLIQNNIWWIEFLGLDGFRLDTYAYSDEAFLMKWVKAIYEEYPNFGLFGEVWVHGIPVQSYFHGNTILDTDFQSGLPALTDFQLHYAIHDALKQDFGWTEGLMRLYYTLAADYIYRDAGLNVLFLDNHDKARYFDVLNKDYEKWKMGLAFMMTTKRIPSIYYGTEILESRGGPRMDDARHDFPGGWAEDPVNKFTSAGRTPLENQAWNYLSKLANWRKDKKVIHEGKLMQFVPVQGIYAYFRYNADETVMVIMNSNNDEVIMSVDRYSERIGSFAKGVDVMTGKTIEFPILKIPARSVYILELE